LYLNNPEYQFSNNFPTNYAYTGQYLDHYTQLLWYNSRYYDPVLGRWSQPDSIVPSAQGSQGFDRYAYVNNSPLRFIDPSGHSFWDVVGQFSQGFVYEFARVNAWMSPDAQNKLAVNATESDAMLAGRIAADVATIVIGVTEVASGLTVATGGTAVAYGATLCLAGAATVAAGAVMTAHGATTALAGAAGLGNNLALLSDEGGSSGNENRDQWKVGDPINKNTAKGYPSWSTVKRRYWQNRAQSALPGEFSKSNLERMRKGMPPLHEKYRVPMELHHKHGRRISDPHNINNLRESWPWEHDDIDPFRHYKGPQP
jgi:RHS repeat-associated protein